MKILIVGSGGREHALAWKTGTESEGREDLLCTGKCRNRRGMRSAWISRAMEFDKLAAFAKEHEIDLTVVGMDDPLVGRYRGCV